MRRLQSEGLRHGRADGFGGGVGAVELAICRPPCITSTRSLMPRTSGNSLEIMMIAMPSPASLRHQRVNLRLGADIDAARRLIHDQDARRLVASHLPSTTFCWLPPTAGAPSAAGRAPLMPKRS
jgi:hypothetical protein